MAPLLQIFQGSNKLHWQAFEWLWNIPHGQQSSITSITVPWICIIISVGVRLFLSANNILPRLDIVISLLLSISKKCCITSYNTWSITLSPRVSQLNIYLGASGAFAVRFSAYRLFFLTFKFFWSCLHGPEWGPAQCKMSYSHCADQHALWALMFP